METIIKIDPQTKKEAQKLFEKMGINLNTAINIFLKQSIREERIPFYIGEPKFKEKVYRSFREVEKMEKNKTIGKKYTNSKEMIEDIFKDE